MLSKNFLEGVTAKKIQVMPCAHRGVGQLQEMDVPTSDIGVEDAVDEEMDFRAHKNIGGLLFQILFHL